MNTKQLLAPLFTVAVAVIGFASATMAQAGEATYDYPVTQPSAVTRAEVKAEAAPALAAGELTGGEFTYFAPATGLAKTRARVVAELREALRLGLVESGDRSVLPTAAQVARVERAGLQVIAITVAAG
jgi:nucleoside phosphorylase